VTQSEPAACARKHSPFDRVFTRDQFALNHARSQETWRRVNDVGFNKKYIMSNSQHVHASTRIDYTVCEIELEKK
jgi:hypothetical protein